jgi:glycosyltransferase involved in cell wall biosynthesis
LDGLYRNSDIFVFPTNHEPYGRVVAEAMAYGLPVVASNIAAIPEILSDGKCGRLVEPGNVDTLVRAILELVDAPVLRERLGKMAREKANNCFDTDIVCKKVIEIIKSTIP